MQWQSEPPTAGDICEVSKDGQRWYPFECKRAEDGHLYLEAEQSTVRAVSGHGGRVIAYSNPGLMGRIKTPAEKEPVGQLSLFECD